MEEQNTEVIDYTELLAQILAEQKVQTAEIQSVKAEIDQCAGDVYGIMHCETVLIMFTVLTFCWSCLRHWRKNVLKVGA